MSPRSGAVVLETLEAPSSKPFVTRGDRILSRTVPGYSDVSGGPSMPGPIRGVVTANTSSHGPLLDMLSTQCFDSYLILVQEHHARGDRFAELQSKAAAKGFRGAWAEATDTGRGGSCGGVA
eukprot:2712227-Pyramimonas_sp.AAC.1